jgi:hypothetical protein
MMWFGSYVSFGIHVFSTQVQRDFAELFEGGFEIWMISSTGDEVFTDCPDCHLCVFSEKFASLIFVHPSV